MKQKQTLKQLQDNAKTLQSIRKYADADYFQEIGEGVKQTKKSKHIGLISCKWTMWHILT